MTNVERFVIGMQGRLEITDERRARSVYRDRDE
jgi:hypothetical protein